MDSDKIKAEMDFHVENYGRNIQKKQRKTVKCRVFFIKSRLSFLRAVRDLFTQEVDKLIVDSQAEYEKILKFVETFMPALKADVKFIRGTRAHL